MSASAEQLPVEVRSESAVRDRLLAAILTALVLFICASAATLIVPLLVALLVSLILAPAVRMLVSARLPRTLAALLVLVSVIVVAGGLLASLAGPAQQWLSDAPRTLGKLERALSLVERPLRAASEAGEKLAELTAAAPPSSPRVVAAEPSLLGLVLKATPAVLAAIVMTLILVFIFLLHGDALLRKLVELAPEIRVKHEIIEATRSAQHDLSIYMLNITLINTVVGVLTASIVWLLGAPNPLLWGGVAALFNYAPYIGPMIVLSALTVVGIGHFPTVWESLSLPGAYLLLNILEGQLFTPLTVGRRMALDPVVVFVGLVTLGWLWGVAGVLLALPLMTCTRIIAERVSGWEVLAKVLRRADAVPSGSDVEH